MIRDKAHRINRFHRRSCRHQHVDAFHILLKGNLVQNMLQQKRFRRKLSCSRIAAGQMAARRFDHLKAIMAQCCQIVLCDRILVHPCIHRRGYQLRTRTRKQRRREHIVRNSMSQLCNHICARRRHNRQICPFCQLHVLHLILKIPVKRIDQTFLSCQCLERDRINKLCCIFRHDYLYIGMLFSEHACQVCRLISSNAPGHS